MEGREGDRKKQYKRGKEGVIELEDRRSNKEERKKGE